MFLSPLCRQLAESGAHVVMAVRNAKRANELIQKWQIESDGLGLGMALNVEVSSMNQLSQKLRKLGINKLMILYYIFNSPSHSDPSRLEVWKMHAYLLLKLNFFLKNVVARIGFNTMS